MVWVLFFAFHNVEYAHELWWQFEFDATAPRALRAVLAVAMLALALGVWQWLRPARARPVRPTIEEIDQARRIATKQSRPDALLALMGDKSFLFSDLGRSFLMFATRGRTWVALGDPVGPPAEWADLVWSFIELADRHGGKVAFYQIPPSSLPLIRGWSRSLQTRRDSPCLSTLLQPRRLRSSRSPLCPQAWRA